MPNIELTENLRTTIRDLRKSKKKRGDELSKELGKGASYISQIENGKIKEIDFSLLNKIFQKITDLSKDDYAKYMNNIIDNSITHMSKEELKHEEWLHQFNYEIRQFPISNELISFIREHLKNLDITPEDFVNIINQNRGLADYDSSSLEPNKLKIEIIDQGKGNEYIVTTSIKFLLPPSFISDIINKKKHTINYITMQGIIYNILLLENTPRETIHDECDKILKVNGFLTIKERNKLIRKNIKEKTNNQEEFTYYDVQPTDYDKKYVNLKEDVDSAFTYLRNRDLLYAVKTLKNLSNNMHFDLGLTAAIMGSDISQLPKDSKRAFWEDYSKLLSSYINKTNLPKQNNKQDEENFTHIIIPPAQ